jgi:endonuclease-3
VTDKIKFLIEYFTKNMPEPETELAYKDEYQLVVAVVLSAQCTDKRVNIITPPFFEKFPNFESLASASFEEVYQLIKSCTYPNNKSKNLIKLAQTVCNEYDGILPQTRDELEKLPGIGRKTANVVASVAFKEARFAVDTHVFRVANRLGIVNAKNPLETEKQLIKLFPEAVIPDAHHWLLLHGRYCCTARNPKCETCGISQICKSFEKK